MGAGQQGVVGMRPKVHRLTGEQQDAFSAAEWGAVLGAVRSAVQQSEAGQATSEAAFQAFEHGIMAQIAECRGLTLAQLCQ